MVFNFSHQDSVLGDVCRNTKSLFKKQKLEVIIFSPELLTAKNIPLIKKEIIRERGLFPYGAPEIRRYLGKNSSKQIYKFAKKWNYQLIFLENSLGKIKDRDIEVAFYRAKNIS